MRTKTRSNLYERDPRNQSESKLLVSSPKIRVDSKENKLERIHENKMVIGKGATKGNNFQRRKESNDRGKNAFEGSILEFRLADLISSASRFTDKS